MEDKQAKQQGSTPPKAVSKPRKRPARGVSARDRKRQSDWFVLKKIYPRTMVVTGVLVGLILSVLVVAGAVLADLRGRIRSADELTPPTNQTFAMLEAPDKTRHRPVRPDLTHPRPDDPSRSIDPSGTPGEVWTGEPSDDPSNGSSAPYDMHNVENILVIGIDSRAGNFSGLSDTMVLVSLNHNTHKMKLVSLFRAAYVYIPYCGWSLLNHAYAWGGPDLLVQTIEMNFRVPITGFVAFNFPAFTSAIDTLGGVPLYLSGAEAAALGMPAGSVWANSRQALAYARLRKIDLDFNRMERQRNVINAALTQLSQSSLTQIYNVVTQVLPWTWTNLDVMKYVTEVPTYLSYSREQMQIPRTCDMYMFYNAYGQETWGFDFDWTSNLLYNFLTN